MLVVTVWREVGSHGNFVYIPGRNFDGTVDCGYLQLAAALQGKSPVFGRRAGCGRLDDRRLIRHWNGDEGGENCKAMHGSHEGLLKSFNQDTRKMKTGLGENFQFGFQV
jgi:hypothetical protein